MQPKFVGRQPELDLLDRLWAQDGAQFLVLYGRRRVGKTRLLSHWVRTSQPRAIFWIADQDSKEAHLRQFSQVVYNFANPDAPAPESFSYASWEQAWAQVAALASTERLALVLDEFTYLMESDPALAGKLQRAWDQTLENRDILLVLSGSHIGMLERGVLSRQAPLYGRATASLHLQPLPYGLTRQYFPGYSAEERVTAYAIFGGIPQYWRLLDGSKSLAHNVQHTLLSPGNLMEGEARLLLQDFIADPHNYISILRAIAYGKTTPKEIEGFTGIPNVHLSQYLRNLMETGYVERRLPVTERKPSRSGRYAITDPYLRFYFRFLASRKTQFALGETQQAYRELQRHLVDFIGSYTWEELCQEWTLRAAGRGELPLFPDQVGSAWNRQAQVDVVGVNFMEKHLVLGECKWNNTKQRPPVLRQLVEGKTAAIIPAQGEWQVYYLGFARRGWSESAREYAAEIDARKPAGANWQVAGARLLDLEAVDADLQAWV